MGVVFLTSCGSKKCAKNAEIWRTIRRKYAIIISSSAWSLLSASPVFEKQYPPNPELTLTRLSLRSRLHDGAAKNPCQQGLGSKFAGQVTRIVGRPKKKEENMVTSSRVEKLVEKLERGISKTIEFYETLDQNKWEYSISGEDRSWTAKELVGHFIASEGYLVRIAQDIATGGKGAPIETDIDKINREDLEKFPELPTSELLNLLKETREKTVKWVRELEDEILDLEGHHPTLGTSTVETVIFSIYAHQLLHMREAVPNLKGK